MKDFKNFFFKDKSRVWALWALLIFNICLIVAIFLDSAIYNLNEWPLILIGIVPFLLLIGGSFIEYKKES
jgi:membrane protein YdbS with pleckstrin-like domain